MTARGHACTECGQPDDLPGWRSVFVENFDDGVAFPGDRLLTYRPGLDTSHNGRYDPRVVTVHDSLLDINPHTVDGVPTGAVVAPCLTGDGTWAGAAQTFGRYAARWRVDPAANYGMAWMLWDATDQWANGEVDFPEGRLDSTMWGYVHTIGNPKVNASWLDTKTPFAGWHETVIEWTPDAIVFLLDGVEVKRTTTSVPQAPMRWTLQVGTAGGKPAPDVSGHVQIDWLSVWAHDPA